MACSLVVITVLLFRQVWLLWLNWHFFRSSKLLWLISLLWLHSSRRGYISLAVVAVPLLWLQTLFHRVLLTWLKSGCYADNRVSKNTAPLSWKHPFYHDYSPFCTVTVLFPWLRYRYCAWRLRWHWKLRGTGNELWNCSSATRSAACSSRTIARRWCDSKSCTASPTMTFFSAAVWARDHTNALKFLKAISVALLHRLDSRGAIQVAPHVS